RQPSRRRCRRCRGATRDRGCDAPVAAGRSADRCGGQVVSRRLRARGDKHPVLTPDQRRKVALIKETLARSDSDVHIYLTALDAFARSLAKFGRDPTYPGGISPVEREYFHKLSAEVLRARDRLDALRTGLRAERELSASLTE